MADGGRGEEVAAGEGGGRTAEVDQNELDFHAVGEEAFDVDGAAVAGTGSRERFGETSEVRGEFHENAVVFHGADDSRNGLTGGEGGRVFFPRSQKFAVRQVGGVSPPRFAVTVFPSSVNIRSYPSPIPT